ncbi:MAG: hypothetical protein M1828_002393 [Chrysothrix sp. TS-e1954]|nr:MAG: hypothetical protein M1828_002393 [Chrysothrix sp. TS-e1954]
MAQKPASIWSKAMSTSKVGFDKAWAFTDKLGAPVNKLSNKLGSEAFWPTTIDKESEKAARILRSFCKDGFYQEELYQTPEGPKAKQQVIKKIPADVIKRAKGLAIFTTMRTGLWFSGAGGSGILIGRKADGEWGPPAGIMLHTAGLGFLVGIDIYDCVLVINTDEALAAFSKWRCTVGGEISAVAGPAGVGGVLETEMHKRQAPVFNYLKSRGFYAGVQIDGTVIIERNDENARFYGGKVAIADVLAGRVPSRTHELEMLNETLKAAQGDNNVKLSLLPSGPPPADYEVVESGHVFGIPDKDDPDPYGVLALEKEGLGIKDATTKEYASTDDFEFTPKLSSPVFSTFRSSSDNSRRESWRRSNLSTATATATTRNRSTSDMSTQTDLDGPPTASGAPMGPPPALPPRAKPESTRSLHSRSASQSIAETPTDTDPDPEGYALSKSNFQTHSSKPSITESHTTSMSHSKEPSLAASPTHSTPSSPHASSQTSPHPNLSIDSSTKSAHSVESPQTSPGIVETTQPPPKLSVTTDTAPAETKEASSGHSSDDEPAIVHQVQLHQASTPQRVNKPRLVSVPKRVTPKLPDRNPGRVRDAVARMNSAGSVPQSPADQSRPSSSRASRPGSPEKTDIPSLEPASPPKTGIPTPVPISPDKTTHHLPSGTSSPSRTSSFKSIELEPAETLPLSSKEQDKTTKGVPDTEQSKDSTAAPEKPHEHQDNPDPIPEGPRVSLAGVMGGLRGAEDDDDDFA